MGDCLRTGKPFRVITNTKVNSVFHPSLRVSKSSVSLSGTLAGAKLRARLL